MNRFHSFAFLGLVLLPLPLGAQFSWDSSNVGSAFTLNDIVMCSSHSGIAVGDNGTIARTTDGGLTWTRPASGTTNQLMAVTFLDSLNGWLAGSQVFMYTTDGGTTWLPPQWKPMFVADEIAFVSRNVGVAAGGAGQIARTTDGGLNWTMAISNLQRTLFGIVYLDSDTAIVVGNHEMGRSTDAGLTWYKTLTPPAVIWDVAALSPQVVVAVGRPTSGSATVYRSTNAGVSWDTLGIAGVSELTAVSFCGPDTGFAAAPTGGVFRTVDGGITWDSVSGVPWGVGTTSISFFSPRTGLLCGLAGVVYHATPTVVSVLDPEPLPERPSLYQNYPNPFNPSTTIRYGLPHAARVILEIHNILGQRVATLVDGDQEPGYHEVGFNARDLSTGVYLYLLKAGDRVATKKLCIVR